MCIFVSQTKPLINKSSDTIIFEEIVLIFFFICVHLYLHYLFDLCNIFFSSLFYMDAYLFDYF
jgi:hypothetical protein